MPRLSLAEWLARLESLHPEEIELGLDRVARVAGALELLALPSKVVTVAGTNGKGTTVAVLAAILHRAGLSTGVYTSPHLLRYNERVCLSGIEAGDAELVEAFEAVDAARGDTPLTYFEFGTLAALWLFKRAAPDVVILEVGLGGRLDAVNIIDAEIAVITRVDLDHESWLGEDREKIGAEKAGILRPGQPLVCADLDPPESVVARAQSLGCPSWYVTEADLTLPAGVSQRAENVAAACRVARLLEIDIPVGELPELLARAGPVARLQQRETDGHPVVLDVAHNPGAVENLARFLADHPVPGRNLALFAALSDKKIHAMIRSCQQQLDAWWLAELPHVGRAMAAAELARALRDCGEEHITCCDSPEAAWQSALSGMRAGDRLVVFGSFFTVAAILPLLGE